MSCRRQRWILFYIYCY